MKVPTFLLTVFFLLSGSLSLQAQLSGTYTIGGSSPDYTTIQSAIFDLNAVGINADVTFEIRHGSYDEQATITNFFRASSTLGVTFVKAAPGAVVTWGYSSAGAANNWVLRLNNADYITVQGITLEATAPSPHGRLIVLANGSSHNTFRNATMRGILGGADDESSIVFGDTGNAEFNTFENVAFLQGATAIDLDGLTSNNLAEGNVIVGCSITGQYVEGIELTRQEDAVIEGNTIRDSAASSSSWRGITAGGTGSQILSNSIDSQAGSSGINLHSNTSSHRRLVANNMVNIRGTNASTVLSVTGGTVDIYHNTLRAASAGEVVSVSAVLSAPGIDIRNNILTNDGGGVVLSNFAVRGDEISDYNVLHTSGPTLVEWGGVSHSTLSSYQSASGLDLNSSVDAVDFVNISGTADLHLNAASDGDLDLVGIALTSVTTDFDGEPRASVNPYKGADEGSISIEPLDNGDTASGFYTVGGSSPDFLDPGSATDHLIARGVKGPATFRIRAGTYAVHKTIPVVPQHDPNTIHSALFIAANANNRPTLRNAAASAASNYVFQLLETSNVEFENIDFVADGVGEWGRIFNLAGAKGIVFDNCSFTGITDGVDDGAALIRDDSGFNNSYLNNSFDNGYFGVKLTGDGSGHLVESNQLMNFTEGGVDASNSDVRIVENQITSSVVNIKGITIGTSSNVTVDKNTIVMTGIVSTGLYISLANDVLVSNNFITASFGAVVAFRAESVSFVHNTINSNGPGTAIAVNEDCDGDIVLQNNIFYDSQEVTTGWVLRVDDKLDLSYSDYNLIRGENLDHAVKIGSTEYSNVLVYRTATGLDLHSTGQDVGFIDGPNGDLHLTGFALNNLLLSALPLTAPEYATDIDGEARITSTHPVPFMGADNRTDGLVLGIEAELEVFLSGPFNTTTGEMNSDLALEGILEDEVLTSPYSNCETATAPAGTFTLGTSVTDWVCIRLLEGDPGNTPLVEVLSKVGILRKDGKIKNSLNQTSILFKFPAARKEYYVVIEHRNHLSVMSATPIDFTTSIGFWDGREDASAYYSAGGTAVRNMGGGKFAMWAGDGDDTGDVTAFDFLNVWLPANGGPMGYHLGDFDLSGDVTAFDFLNAWLPSNGQASQVP